MEYSTTTNRSLVEYITVTVNSGWQWWVNEIIQQWLIEMNIYWLIWTSWLSLSLFLSWEDSTHVTSRCERCQRARYRLLAVAAHFSPGYLTVCCFCFSNWKNMAAMWFSANPGYNFHTIQLSHTFQVVLNILFTKQFGNVIPGWKNDQKKAQ